MSLNEFLYSNYTQLQHGPPLTKTKTRVCVYIRTNHSTGLPLRLLLPPERQSFDACASASVEGACKCHFGSTSSGRMGIMVP